MEPRVSIRWLGVAGVEITCGDRVLAIDPFLSRPPLRYLLFGRPETRAALVARTMPRCDYILVSHSHWDHVMDVPQVIRQTGAVAFGSANTGALLALHGIPGRHISAIEAGQSTTLGPFKVMVGSAHHPPAPFLPGPGPLARGIRPPLRLRNYRIDTCLSFSIAVSGLRLLYTPREPSPGDVLFMGPVFNRTRAEELLRAIHPRAVVFVHRDNLFRPFTAPERPLLSPAAASMARERRWAEKVIPRARVPCPEVLKRYDLEDLLSESDERPGLSGPRRSS